MQAHEVLVLDQQALEAVEVGRGAVRVTALLAVPTCRRAECRKTTQNERHASD